MDFNQTEIKYVFKFLSRHLSTIFEFSNIHDGNLGLEHYLFSFRLINSAVENQV